MSRRQIIMLAVLLLAACALPFVVSNYRTFQFTLVMVYAIALLGLNMLTGYNGQISLGHGAFVLIGAYTAAILTDRESQVGFVDGAPWPFWTAMTMSGLVAAVAGIAVAHCPLLPAG